MEVAEHGRGWPGPAAHREGMLSGIYTVMVKEDLVQVQGVCSILQKLGQWETSPGVISPRGNASAFVNFAVVHIPVSIRLKGIHSLNPSVLIGGTVLVQVSL